MREIWVQSSYLAATIFFFLGLKQLGHPATARRGNYLGAAGMGLAVLGTAFHPDLQDPWLPLLAVGLGSIAGIVSAQRVVMTAMPQMVALLNGLGGAASALVAIAEYLRLSQVPLAATQQLPTLIALLLGLLIGGVTLSGSLVAFAKLQGLISGQPLTLPSHRLWSLLLLLGFVSGAVLFLVAPQAPTALAVLTALAIATLLLGLFFVAPVGGGDMPVVIALLNSLSGLAASAAGFAVNNNLLIIAGALVGASGLILTVIMCKAMNRSLTNVLFSGLVAAGGQADGGTSAAGDRNARQIDSDEGAMLLGYARSVVIVPGYGMAVAQAQHTVRELAEHLQRLGVEVKYAIHPVAGRMPGHMNVLLAEANVPYGQLYDLESINSEFEHTDVALVIGANDVVNPAARLDNSSPIYGMPILDVDRARQTIVIKRSMANGYAGIDNPLFYGDRTVMLFGSAREVISQLVGAVKELS
ncbi:NAD(P)(+) transhydrogenase (Re/Si-specific) subunit beta [Synechococcus elongatus]|uniref:NAD(P) transhydrogenase subunit beta n=1 Tax=Synechococcus elongatus (strain ATCC 33912 / PCC 7942 / FACHB-805) TaxID=1140 RepID=Q31MS9_SYNE7|nr:NAD(P)(+) transhydrogenase (Re/Si-specific) subunit beta [Synechococcus elongatus]ABB57640.1 pyridine nucleotide transhydrogenase beta subunit [Synechococcus elongatus PCC 7942 = FACHB-805]AJD57980.1 NAD synthetase [Synechococcus elongatus UTEX 2973]MBD2588448.1 NAD(P)(+) transhydrogenase (Re/Si-specific) subunit beta [Synechococcus elongatus FACHB-242]MBD2689389.1 NAD(P)(+) transhydrogenase (Re/Si-specific) subunit beta [Synechococcus elongatus FACHB-1061]MBD2708192.1 NAD(P)(+) transhydrog